MTDALPPAGWYADPAGSANERWWAGLEWTDHLRPTPLPVIAAPRPAEPEAYQPMSGWVPAGTAAPQQREMSVGSPNTRGIWALAFSPAIIVLVRAIATWAPSAVYIPSLIIGIILLIAYLVVATRADQAVLRVRGLPTASPWWMLLSTAAYFIARRLRLRAAGIKHHAPANVFVLVLFASSALFVGIVSQVGTPQVDQQNIQMLETELAKQFNAEGNGVWTVTCEHVVASVVGSEVPCTATSDQAQVVHLIATLGADGYFTPKEVPAP